ncbi:jg4928 [Pararge aegeria aegeria]|uniref:Jg4928 protein n=1 Tax=Pararge aegeria aegeria TaxID=348720 RepID=A0A8S4SC97_9NEOP|nr:jg4928 [Pararge aegeria aegeria]
MERAILGVSLRDKTMRSVLEPECEAEVAMGGEHSLENRWKLGSHGKPTSLSRCKRSVCRPPARWTDAIQKTYVQQWTSMGKQDDDEC